MSYLTESQARAVTHRLGVLNVCETKHVERDFVLDLSIFDERLLATFIVESKIAGTCELYHCHYFDSKALVAEPIGDESKPMQSDSEAVDDDSDHIIPQWQIPASWGQSLPQSGIFTARVGQIPPRSVDPDRMADISEPAMKQAAAEDIQDVEGDSLNNIIFSHSYAQRLLHLSTEHWREVRSAKLIQSLARGLIGRYRLARGRHTLQAVEYAGKLERSAAKKIQYTFRGYLTRLWIARGRSVDSIRDTFLKAKFSSDFTLHRQTAAEKKK